MAPLSENTIYLRKELLHSSPHSSYRCGGVQEFQEERVWRASLCPWLMRWVQPVLQADSPILPSSHGPQKPCGRRCTALPLFHIFVHVPSQGHDPPLSTPALWGTTVQQCFLPVPSQVIMNRLMLGVDGNDLPTSSTNQQDSVETVHQDLQELHIVLFPFLILRWAWHVEQDQL